MFKNLVIVLLFVTLVFSVGTLQTSADTTPNIPVETDVQFGSNALIYVQSTLLPAFHVTWTSSNEANSYSYLDPLGCNFDPACAANGQLLWNSFAKDSEIIVYSDHDPALTCSVCSVQLYHYKYSIDDQFYRATVAMPGYWITTFSRYP